MTAEHPEPPDHTRGGVMSCEEQLAEEQAYSTRLVAMLKRILDDRQGPTYGEIGITLDSGPRGVQSTRTEEAPDDR